MEFRMAKKVKYEETVEKMLEPIAADKGVRIYDVDYVKEGPDYFLRCYIDKDGGVNIGDLPTTTVRMAIAFVGILPVLIIYPFFQKYFAKGLAMGAVKG